MRFAHELHILLFFINADVISYIDDIIASIDLQVVNNKDKRSRLLHVIALTQELPKWMSEIKRKFN